jgi:hypothetical protein
MKRFLFLLLIFSSSLCFSQTTYTIVKMGSSGLKVKVNGIIIVKDSTLYIKTDTKGVVDEYTLKIINKTEKEMASSYQCLGMIGNSDKHVFTILTQQKTIIWTFIDSFSNTKNEMLIYYQ